MVIIFAPPSRSALRGILEMAKTPSKGGRGGKETIIPPNKKEGSAASGLLRKGSSAGARVMADLSVAKREGVKPRKK
jgi:hypothetical protein